MRRPGDRSRQPRPSSLVFFLEKTGGPTSTGTTKSVGRRTPGRMENDFPQIVSPETLAQDRSTEVTPTEGTTSEPCLLWVGKNGVDRYPPAGDDGVRQDGRERRRGCPFSRLVVPDRIPLRVGPLPSSRRGRAPVDIQYVTHRGNLRGGN